MPINETNEKRFEADIESALLSPAGGYVKGEDTYIIQNSVYLSILFLFMNDMLKKPIKQTFTIIEIKFYSNLYFH